MKHFAVDSYVVIEKSMYKEISTNFVNSYYQLENISTKLSC